MSIESDDKQTDKVKKSSTLSKKGDEDTTTTTTKVKVKVKKPRKPVSEEVRQKRIENLKRANALRKEKREEVQRQQQQQQQCETESKK
jgi:hypothetical protein